MTDTERATRITRIIETNLVKNKNKKDEDEVNRILKRIEGRKVRIRRWGAKLAESQTYELQLQ